jgi:hypothetical protein
MLLFLIIIPDEKAYFMIGIQNNCLINHGIIYLNDKYIKNFKGKIKNGMSINIILNRINVNGFETFIVASIILFIAVKPNTRQFKKYFNDK